MKIPIGLLSASALLTRSPNTTTAPPTAHSKPRTICSPHRPNYCAGTSFNASKAHLYICGDSRLGPVHLPTKLPLDSLLDIYDRFGGLCPGEFLDAWYNASAGWWMYPPQDGFSLDTEGQLIQGDLVLPPGALLDRFGSEYGSFVSPAAAPYMQRALPPSNLDSPVYDPRFPYNYHIYRVLEPLEVLAGPIAPWFGQPGQGVQYKLWSNVLTLVNNGILERVDPSVLIQQQEWRVHAGSEG